MWHSISRIFFTSLFYILFILSLNAQSNNRFLEKIGIQNGLSSNYPSSIIQDSKGFIWIGTNNGLNRYDGYQSKVFKYDPNNINTISDNWITSLLEDSNGNIWIGTDGGGLNLYNTTTGAITRFKHNKDDSTSISSNLVLRIYEDSKLRLWVGTKNGLNLLDRSKLTFQNWLQPNACKKCEYSVRAIAGDNKGNLWIGDEFNGLYYFTPSNGKFAKPHLKYSGDNRLPSEFINDIHFSKGTLWVATVNGLAILNTLTEAYEKINLDVSDQNFIREVFIWKIYNDNQGSIWICTNSSGLINYKLETKQINIYKSDGVSNHKIGSNSVEDVLIDKSKNVWIATRGDGLNKFNLNVLKFNHWENINGNSNSLVNNNVRALLQDVDGTIWIGTNDGLSRFNPTSKLFRNYIKDFNYMADIKSPKIRTIHRSKNNELWIGTQNGGLYRYNELQDRFLLAFNFMNSPLATKIRHIESIYEPEKGTLWLGTLRTGFIAYNTTTGEFKNLLPYNNPDDILLSLTVNCMLEASKSEIWVGSNRGLILLNTNTLQFKLWAYKEGCDNCIVGNKIRSLFRDSHNKIWIGTRSGLAIFEPKSEKFEQYRVSDGLASDIVFGILSGNDGNIWLTTPNGLSRVNPLNMQFKNIRIPENNILDMGGHSQGLDGTLLVGGTAGLTIFNPNDIKTNPYKPEVVITDIKIDNQSMVFDKNISELDAIDLSYNQNNLTFEFSALEFTNSQNNQYQYKLEGFNDEWIEYGSKHDLTFTNLDPKKYVLNIKGSNNEGIWNEQETSLTIDIKPPWWGTLLFRLLSVFIIIGSILTVYYSRIKRLKKAEANLQKEVHRQTKELIESNKEMELLHKEKDGIIKFVAHDLQAPLNNIDSISQLLEDNGNLDEEQKMFIGYINESVKSGNSLITDLLFMSNDNQQGKSTEFEDFDLSEFITVWEKAYIARLEEKEQKLRKYLGKESLRIHSDKKLVGRIFDNLMTNAIKFSNKGSNIDLSANTSNGQVVISFKDHGPGMSESDKKTAFKMFQKLSAQPTDGESSHGLGLAIVKTLVEKLKGSIKIESKLGQGTDFIVSLPIAKNVITAPSIN